MVRSSGDMGACWVGAGQQRRHGRVLARDGNMGACWVGAAQQWRRGRVLAKDGDIVVLLGGCWPTMEA